MNEKLKKARIQRNLTQAETAQKNKISIRAYQNYEAGIRIPNVIVAKKIANVLDRTIEELFSLSEINKEESDGNQIQIKNQ